MMNIIRDLCLNKKGKLIIPFILMGICGMVIEIFFTALVGSKPNDHEYISLMGITSLWCILIYGTGGTIISVLNELPSYYRMTMRKQTLIGGVLVIATEFMYGVIFNIVLGFDLWSYTRFPNILGQIDIVHSICWFAGIPFFIWLYDVVIGYGLYHEDWNYNLLDNYKELFKKPKFIK